MSTRSSSTPQVRGPGAGACGRASEACLWLVGSQLCLTAGQPRPLLLGTGPAAQVHSCALLHVNATLTDVTHAALPTPAGLENAASTSLRHQWVQNRGKYGLANRLVRLGQIITDLSNWQRVKVRGRLRGRLVLGRRW